MLPAHVTLVEVGPRDGLQNEPQPVATADKIELVRLLEHAGQHRGGIGHLRHPFRADEAGDLDVRQAGLLQPLHQLDLVGGGHRLRLVLQAVARTDLDQGDV